MLIKNSLHGEFSQSFIVYYACSGDVYSTFPGLWNLLSKSCTNYLLLFCGYWLHSYFLHGNHKFHILILRTHSVLSPCVRLINVMLKNGYVVLAYSNIFLNEQILFFCFRYCNIAIAIKTILNFNPIIPMASPANRMC